METVKISNIEQKTSKANKPYWVVEFSDGRKASLWETQLADFLIKDVKVGGTVKVEIAEKNNYLNIMAVDMVSANKTTIPNVPVVSGSVRDISIVAQVMVKEANNFICSLCEKTSPANAIDFGQYEEAICKAVQVLVKAYKVAVSELEK